uniref:Chromosome 1 open reading frame 109 n=1 Tax=Cairina moschata TaxID=8855 RepID=A0A8C3BV96_CAIMO
MVWVGLHVLCNSAAGFWSRLKAVLWVLTCNFWQAQSPTCPRWRAESNRGVICQQVALQAAWGLQLQQPLLEQLGRRREELRALRDAVGTGAASVLRVYEENAAELGLAETLRRGARRPSLADVLEGLQDVERYYRHLYLESKLLLLSISCDSLEDMEALPQAWKRILERYEEDTVQGSSSRGRPKGCLLAWEAEGLPTTQLLCWAQ